MKITLFGMIVVIGVLILTVFVARNQRERTVAEKNEPSTMPWLTT